MIILDTDVISALMQSVPDPLVIGWLDSQPAESIWTTSICVFEIAYGLQSLPKGTRQKSLQNAFDKTLDEDLKGRILDLDFFAASEAAIIAAKLRSKGRPVEIRDVLIAGIASARRGVLATRNVKHFSDTQVQIINPWDTTTS